MRRLSRGFSLIEVLIAVAVAAFGIAAAARFAAVAQQAATRGTESGDSAQQMRLVTNQLRIDLRLAGMGSTGAVGVNPAAAPWNLVTIQSSGGFIAMPAVIGANNIAAASVVAGWTVVPGSDAIQLVVPDPSTLQKTTVVSPAGNTINTALLMTCPSPLGGPDAFVYVVDHGRANGAGRTQILTIINGSGAGPITTTADNLVFDLAPNSDVMCARVSTYWLGQDPLSNARLPWLHRTDLVPSSGTPPTSIGGAISRVLIASDAVTPQVDLLAPGVFGMQIAYEMSSEVPGLGRTALPTARWAYNNPLGGAADPTLACGNNGASLGSCWFEARQVRVNLVVGIARTGESVLGSAIINEPAVEDGAPLGVPRAFARYSLTTGEVLASLRFFDKGTPANVPARPY